MDEQLRRDVAALNKVATQARARRVIPRARYRRVNARRAELIYAHPAADDPRAAELAELQEVTRRVIELAYPPPEPSALEKMLLERYPDIT